MRTLILALLLILSSSVAIADKAQNKADYDYYRPKMYDQEWLPIIPFAQGGGLVGRGIGKLIGAPFTILNAPLAYVTDEIVSYDMPIRLGGNIGLVTGTHIGAAPIYLPYKILWDIPKSLLGFNDDDDE